MTEQELIQLAKNGDQDAFGQLMLQNEKRIFNLTRRLAGNPEDGEELAQEAFLNAWRGLSKFQGDSSFATWVYRLASNACIDFLRKEKRRQSISMTVSLDDDEEGRRQTELPDQGPTPERALEQKEIRQAIDQGLSCLSDQHRQVLVMRELSGLSYTEIAGLLGLEEGTVKSRIARARTALRNQLQKDGNFFSSLSSTKAKDPKRVSQPSPDVSETL